MEFTLKSQILNFFVSFVFGIIFSIIFDIFKIFGIILNKISVNIRDFSYFLIYGIFSFLLSLAINNGDFSFYIVLAEFLGWILWHNTLSKKILRVSEKLIENIKKPLLDFFEQKLVKKSRFLKNKLSALLKSKKENIINNLKHRKNKEGTKKHGKKFLSDIFKINKTNSNKV